MYVAMIIYNVGCSDVGDAGENEQLATLKASGVW